jgi:four helix bundle protein
MRDYKKLNVWVKAYSFGLSVYAVTKLFPKEELYGLTSQMRQANLSIPLHIAEGSRRSTEKYFRSFLHIAYRSGTELEVQRLFPRDLGYSTSEKNSKLILELSEMMMPNSLIKKLS